MLSDNSHKDVALSLGQPTWNHRVVGPVCPNGGRVPIVPPSSAVIRVPRVSPVVIRADLRPV